MKEYLGDILAYNKKRQLVLIVVTANQRSKSREWAAEYRRNLYVNAELPKTPFFVIALPDHFCRSSLEYPQCQSKVFSKPQFKGFQQTRHPCNFRKSQL